MRTELGETNTICWAGCVMLMAMPATATTSSLQSGELDYIIWQNPFYFDLYIFKWERSAASEMLLIILCGTEAFCDPLCSISP
jgi:hypothetical protein